MSNQLDKVQIKALFCSGLERMGGLATWNQVGDFIAKHGYDPRGTTASAYEQNPNVTFWIGQHNFIEGATELRAEGLIDLIIVSPVLYTMDRAALDLPILSPRRLNILLRNWESTGWIDRPVWVPTVLVLAGIDFFEKPITTQMLQAAIGGSDEGIVRQDKFEALASAAGEPSPIDGAGRGGNDA